MLPFEEFFGQLMAGTPDLAPREPLDQSLSQRIRAADLFSGMSGEMVDCCRAGLLLFNDDLGAAHEIVQNVDSQTGSFWHAIVHRREGDFGNARYWWNLTGAHPAFDELHDLVLHRVPDFPFLDEVRQAQTWEPLAFNAACQAGSDRDGLEAVQKIEMGTLLRWCASRVK